MLFVLMSRLRRATVDLYTWQDAGKNENGVGRGKKFWTAQNFSPRKPWVAHVVNTCNTRETHVTIRVPAVGRRGKTRKFRGLSRAEHGHGRVLRVGITGNSVCLAAYDLQMDFSMPRQCLGSAWAVLRQCFSSGTAADGHTVQSTAKPKLTKNYHLRPRPTDFHNFLYVI